MALSFTASTAHAMLNVITAHLDAGAAAGRVRIYSGAAPANADAALAAGNIQLAELVCSDPSSAAAANKTLTLNAITQDAAADASGTATFFRLVDSTGVTVLQGDITPSGSGGALEMNTISLIVGGPVQITSAAFTLA